MRSPILSIPPFVALGLALAMAATASPAAAEPGSAGSMLCKNRLVRPGDSALAVERRCGFPDSRLVLADGERWSYAGKAGLPGRQLQVRDGRVERIDLR